MKINMVTISLCLLVGVQSMFYHFGVSDLVQLPELWDHYQAHLKESPQSSFAEFIHLHYDADSKHLNQDPIHHQKLPFSKRTHGQNVVLIVFISSSMSEIITRLSLIRSISGVNYTLDQSVKAIAAIWQPPRA